MIAYQKERIENAICFFASEFKKRVGRPAYQTYIYKYLALFDFQILKETGKPALDIGYDALDKGPVPKYLYYSRKKHEATCYRFITADGESKIIEPVKEPDLDFFSDHELAVMWQILDRYAYPGITTNVLIDASHDIQSWKTAWARRGQRRRVPMSYDDTFQRLNEKTEAKRTPEEESYLIFKAIKQAAG